MSEPDLDALAEAARNRGLKLIRSRVRTPGKRRFGRVGLADAAGKALFGMDGKGPIGKPEDAAAYLRGLGAQDWGASLDRLAPQRKRTGKPPKGKKAAANDGPSPLAKPTPTPKPSPKVQVREAQPRDADDLVALIGLLGHEVDAPGVRKRLAALKKSGVPQLVATLGKQVIGLVGIHAMTVVHRDKPVGRITILVVSEVQRDKGLGRMLVEAAEARLKAFGCGMVEITSNDRLTAAHAFYRHMGYERTSIRFAKTL